LRSIGERCNAEVREFLLWMPKELVLQRAEKRGYLPGNLLTPEKTALFWEQINTLRNNRPQAKVIDVTNLSQEQVLETVMKNMEE
jgi:hypothetical protein